MAGGRPRKEIDMGKVAELASIMCTHEEIAAILGCHVSTLEHNEEFLQVYKKAFDQGKQSVRRAQYKAAMDGNVTMQIWLGKQYLGQKDKQEHEIGGNGKPITVKVVKVGSSDGTNN
jgi:hypothetical protein